MRHNIALFGQFCAGKSTLARVLADNHGYERASMAFNIKDMFYSVYGTLDKGASISVTKRDGTTREVSVRQGLQILGESVKDLDRDFWLKWLLRDTEFMSGPLVIDDARLVFEAEALKSRGWVLVKVETPEDVRLERFVNLYGRKPTKAETEHPTETQLLDIKFDYLVDGVLPPEPVADRLLTVLRKDRG